MGFSDALAPRAPAGFLRGCMLSDVCMARRRCVQLRPSGRLAWGFPVHGAGRVVLVSPWSSGICNSPRAAPVPSWCRAHDERSGAPFAEAWRANSIRCLPSPLLVALVLTPACRVIHTVWRFAALHPSAPQLASGWVRRSPVAAGAVFVIGCVVKERIRTSRLAFIEACLPFKCKQACLFWNYCMCIQYLQGLWK